MDLRPESGWNLRQHRASANPYVLQDHWLISVGHYLNRTSTLKCGILCFLNGKRSSEGGRAWTNRALIYVSLCQRAQTS